MHLTSSAIGLPRRPFLSLRLDVCTPTFERTKSFLHSQIRRELLLRTRVFARPLIQLYSRDTSIWQSTYGPRSRTKVLLAHPQAETEVSCRSRGGTLRSRRPKTRSQLLAGLQHGEGMLRRSIQIMRRDQGQHHSAQVVILRPACEFESILEMLPVAPRRFSFRKTRKFMGRTWP